MIPFRTLKNKIIDLGCIREEDIFIEDIAHALSMQCRYNGQIPEFYSVAQHSILVAWILMGITKDYKIALCGLLHDAAEAYIGDIVSPLKDRLPLAKEIESRIMSRILDKYGIKHAYIKNKELIDRIDHRFYELEVKYFFGCAKSICGDVPSSNHRGSAKSFLGSFNRYNIESR